jgi:hypothetical protein
VALNSSMDHGEALIASPASLRKTKIRTAFSTSLQIECARCTLRPYSPNLISQFHRVRHRDVFPFLIHRQPLVLRAPWLDRSGMVPCSSCIVLVALHTQEAYHDIHLTNSGMIDWERGHDVAGSAVCVGRTFSAYASQSEARS